MRQFERTPPPNPDPTRKVEPAPRTAASKIEDRDRQHHTGGQRFVERVERLKAESMRPVKGTAEIPWWAD